MRDHLAVVRNRDETFHASGPCRAQMYPVHFLRTHWLNPELHAFLLSLGYPAASIGFILQESKISPPGGIRQATDHWERMYTPELKDVVRQKERLIFRLFPEFDPPE